ncbi:PPM1L [Lepeophtheirus salmonis]|uniref:PPM1L n=1 Tax=Lepeophtheirus salmonis TaxID=72036 RepID=A0A7R8HAQ6_LEPSM|nr:PPM1L [Lepeophtheirus salmonis]CAF2979087.1 PPM1L [Lepeophtheirus salmonis]
MLSKEKPSYSGTTLILSVLDEENLWVANVGDSRGVLCNENGATIPLSYDHKPSQLKEKKRIEEAGGFVSMNGVWRVQGILATSRALGDFPLKDKKLINCEPDILSFSLLEHKPRFMILASDGLWDTHSNEEALKSISRHCNTLGGIKVGLKHLCNDAISKGSFDNITILVHKF